MFIKVFKITFHKLNIDILNQVQIHNFNKNFIIRSNLSKNILNSYFNTIY